MRPTGMRHLTSQLLCGPVRWESALGPSLSPGNWFSGPLSSLWLDVRWGMSLVGVNCVLLAGTTAGFYERINEDRVDMFGDQG